MTSSWLHERIASTCNTNESVPQEGAAQTPAWKRQGQRWTSVQQIYGAMRWKRPANERGHTFVLIDAAGTIRAVHDFGAPERGGLMDVPVQEGVQFVAHDLGGR